MDLNLMVAIIMISVTLTAAIVMISAAMDITIG